MALSRRLLGALVLGGMAGLGKNDTSRSEASFQRMESLECISLSSSVPIRDERENTALKGFGSQATTSSSVTSNGDCYDYFRHMISAPGSVNRGRYRPQMGERHCQRAPVLADLCDLHPGTWKGILGGRLDCRSAASIWSSW